MKYFAFSLALLAAAPASAQSIQLLACDALEQDLVLRISGNVVRATVKGTAVQGLASGEALFLTGSDMAVRLSNNDLLILDAEGELRGTCTDQTASLNSGVTALIEALGTEAITARSTEDGGVLWSDSEIAPEPTPPVAFTDWDRLRTLEEQSVMLNQELEEARGDAARADLLARVLIDAERQRDATSAENQALTTSLAEVQAQNREVLSELEAQQALSNALKAQLAAMDQNAQDLQVRINTISQDYNATLARLAATEAARVNAEAEHAVTLDALAGQRDQIDRLETLLEQAMAELATVSKEQDDTVSSD